MRKVVGVTFLGVLLISAASAGTRKLALKLVF